MFNLDRPFGNNVEKESSKIIDTKMKTIFIHNQKL